MVRSGDCMVSWDEVIDMVVRRSAKPPLGMLACVARFSTPDVSRSLLRGPAEL